MISKHLPLVNFYSMIVCMLLCTAEAEMGKCSLSIDNRSFKHSWQSSTRFHYCFNSSFGQKNTYRYFHSGEGSTYLDDGHHWLVIKLNQSQVVASVSIKNRDVSEYEKKDNLTDVLNSRAADIEIWTTQNDYEFGSEHCNSTAISKKFYETMSNWSMCGRTKPTVKSNETLIVNCHQVKPVVSTMILLRKNVSNVSDERKQCMSFVNMWISTVSVSNPTQKLKISVDENICVDQQASNLTFGFESSDSNPAPQHECYATDENGYRMNLFKQNTIDDLTCDPVANVLKSVWFCLNCSGTYSSLTLSCTASHDVTNRTFFNSLICPSKKSVFSATAILPMLLILTAVACAVAVGICTFKLRSRGQCINGFQNTASQFYEGAESFSTPQELNELEVQSVKPQVCLQLSDSNYNPSLSQQAECSYEVVKSAQSDLSLDSERPPSEWTLYTEIVADGNGANGSN